MFKKLLKYDMKSIAKVWWIVAVSVLGASFIMGLFLRFIIDNIENDAYGIFLGLAMLMTFLCIFGIMMSILVTEILVYLRFYKNFYTDEGYLTFTLPVSRKELLLSKTLNALIWNVAHVLLYVLCICIILPIVTPAVMGTGVLDFSAFSYIGNEIAQAWSMMGAWLIVYAIEALAIAVLGLLFSINLIHFCITMGAMVAKKLKLLAAIGIYYIVNMVLSFILQIAGALGMVGIEAGVDHIMLNASQGVACFSLALMLLLVCCVIAAMNCVLYFMMLGRLERKLNLA